MIGATPEQITSYFERARKVREAFEALPHGSQSRCSYDIRCSPSILSQIVRGILVDPDRMVQVEGWLENEAGYSVGAVETSAAHSD